ncbi:hypothetical protein niasHS_001388 [Heterodera schachtii]|uniref:G-protein coupled receptors family 1 profile domain-containing protein n=1 Tax=Heterodera schachtii TaxID=97005 RepID=A0ABD2KDZ2_HETSC
MLQSLYLAYRSVGPSADLIVPAVALYLVAFVGIVLNGTVLVVTVKSSSLRGSANFLMALICLCELVHQIGHTFLLFVVISGTNFVSLLTADLIMTIFAYSSVHLHNLRCIYTELCARLCIRKCGKVWRN